MSQQPQNENENTEPIRLDDESLGDEPDNEPLDYTPPDDGLEEELEELEEEEERKQEKKAAKREWYITVGVIVCLTLIVALLLVMFQRCSSEPPVLHPDYPPQEDDSHAIPIPGDDTDKLENEEGGGAVSLQFKDELTIDLSDKQASLSFANPGRSTQDMVVWLMIQDQVIIRSGRIRPGYRVDTLDLLEDAEKMLSEGVYQGKFIIYYYNPETNERAMVNTEAPVTVTVKK